MIHPRVETAPRLARPGPLVVELVGPPGAGKTTGRVGVHTALRRAGWQTFDPEEGARIVVSRTIAGRMVARLPVTRVRSALLWRVYIVHRLMGLARLVVRRPAHFIWLARHQRHRPTGALVRRRRPLYWYLRLAGAQEFYRRHARDGEAVVFDEGHVHRVVQLFSSPVERGSAAHVARFLAGVPRPDLLVAVGCPIATCLERIRHRGVWSRLQDVPADHLDAFVENADGVIRDAIEHARSRGWDLVEIDNGKSGAADFSVRIDSAVADGLHRVPVGQRPVARPLYRWFVPRPRQLSRLVRGRLARPGISAVTVDSFLSELEIDRTGRVTHLPLGRRSDSVRVETGRGRLVVRAYPDHWPEGAVMHEHSLLQHLEKAGYPSARLVAAPGGETVIEVDGRRMAAYRFAPGANLSGSFLPAGPSLDAHHLAGRLQARLHQVTADLLPEGEHHLAMDHTEGASRLASQLALLHELAAAPQSVTADALKRRAGEIAKRLRILHSTLMEAEPSVAVIHGDFGLHNILLRRDGTATVHDFELARRDWCLVDVVEALGSMAEGRREAFLAGYHREAGARPAEWVHLAGMWEYHRLGGAVRAWQSSVERNSMERLEVARRRLAEADRIAAEGVATWL